MAGLGEDTRGRAGIGTLGERSLHAALKAWYAQPGDRLEAAVDGYVIDLVRGDQLIEIQTWSFAPLKRKLERLTRSRSVRLVYPIAVERWIVRLAPDRITQLSRRRSPKRGQAAHVFDQLVSFPVLIARDSFSLEILLIREEEVRCQDGRGSWRRSGWSILDRRLLEVTGRLELSTPEDCQALLPADLPAEFTSRDLAAAMREPVYRARRMAYCLRAMGVLQTAGRRGNAYLYSVRNEQPR